MGEKNVISTLLSGVDRCENVTVFLSLDPWGIDDIEQVCSDCQQLCENNDNILCLNTTAAIQLHPNTKKMKSFIDFKTHLKERVCPHENKPK